MLVELQQMKSQGKALVAGTVYLQSAIFPVSRMKKSCII